MHSHRFNMILNSNKFTVTYKIQPRRLNVTAGVHLKTKLNVDFSIDINLNQNNAVRNTTLLKTYSDNSLCFKKLARYFKLATSKCDFSLNKS